MEGLEYLQQMLGRQGRPPPPKAKRAKRHRPLQPEPAASGQFAFDVDISEDTFVEPETDANLEAFTADAQASKHRLMHLASGGPMIRWR